MNITELRIGTRVLAKYFATNEWVDATVVAVNVDEEWVKLFVPKLSEVVGYHISHIRVPFRSPA